MTISAAKYSREQMMDKLQLVAAKKVFGKHINQQVIDTLGSWELILGDSGRTYRLFGLPYLKVYYHKLEQNDLKQWSPFVYYRLLLPEQE